MSNILKGGWHPKGRDGGKESWRGDFKGINQIANKFGKGRDADAEKEREQHVSAPLTSLRDPSSFGAPPKHTAYYPNASPSTSASSSTPRPPTGPTSLGGAIPRETIQQQQQAAYRAQQEEEEEEKPPPGPYQVNTTGLSTANLPKPPVRRVDNSSPTPPPPRSARASPAPPPRSAIAAPPPPSAPKAAPRLPPRLPPRQNSRPDLHTPEPPPSYNEAATVPAPDHAAVNRLGQAGVSVPGFDIGSSSSSTRTSPHHTPTLPGAPQAAQVNELQSRFRSMQFGSPKPPSPSPSASSANSSSHYNPTNNPNNYTPPTLTPATESGGTTWDQKRHAATTAQSFHKDPSSVSFSDARSAASTANNFRQRHGETVKSGYASAREMGSKYGQQAKDMNTKYGISDRAKGYADKAVNYNRSTPSTMSASSSSSSSAGAGAAGGYGGGAAAVAGKKAPPPPPPPKKRELGGVGLGAGSAHADGADGPPPLPLSSKPR